jgi:signal transduction histidine kinase
MKRTLLSIILLVKVCSNGHAQIVNPPPGYLDSLKSQSAVAKEDTSRVLALTDLSWLYSFIDFDSASMYSQLGQNLAQKIAFHRGVARSIYALGQAYQTKGDIPKALDLYLNSLKIAEENHCNQETVTCLTEIGNVFSDLNDWPKALSYYYRANKINEIIKNEKGADNVKFLTDINLGFAYVQNNQLDSAFVCLENLYNSTLDNNAWHCAALLFFGDLQFRLGKRDVAFDYLHQSLEILQSRNDHLGTADACKFLARFFKEMNQSDSCIYYAKKGLAEAQIISYTTTALFTSKLLAEQYETKDISLAHYYLKLAMAFTDELYGSKKVQDLQKIFLAEQERNRQFEVDRVAYENRLKQYVFAVALMTVLLIAFFLYRNNRQKQKANMVLQQQKEEIAVQKNTTEKALNELKSMQSQLIQSEKMASLGELTAGIAHEIQNPLNFVNNFSELSNELITEMNEEIDKGNTDEVKSIALDIKQNLEKINHHGKRADSIVKGMLQHSQKGSGQKEPTDINAMAEEYLRLSYHGTLAKDITLNATFETDLDKNIGNVNLVQQDISRVLLNLYTNAFYAVAERQKMGTGGYQPTVTVTTKKKGAFIEISVKDNGSGIPESIKNKIFQPFFTTKPTGQGTGLGLSLSYDIVKAQGGELKVESKEGKGSEFVILLPIV